MNYDTLVLSGGGVKGFVLLGACQGLIDSKVLENITNYVGTSIGAIICYLLAIGYTPIEIVTNVYSNKWLEKIQNYNIIGMVQGNGAASFTPIQEALEKLTLNKIGKFITMEKLYQEYGKKLYCTTYNMTVCKTEYISYENHPDMPCLTALRMSANIPLVFDRFKYLDCYYIDGGLSDNFPISKGIEIGNKVIGIFLDIQEKGLQDNPEDGIISYIFKLLQVPIIQSTRYRANYFSEKADIIPVCMSKLNSGVQFDVDSKLRLDMFSAGYKQVKDHITKKEISEDEKTELD